MKSKEMAHRYRPQQIYRDSRNIDNYQDTDTKIHGQRTQIQSAKIQQNTEVFIVSQVKANVDSNEARVT